MNRAPNISQPAPKVMRTLIQEEALARHLMTVMLLSGFFAFGIYVAAMFTR